MNHTVGAAIIPSKFFIALQLLCAAMNLCMCSASPCMMQNALICDAVLIRIGQFNVFSSISLYMYTYAAQYGDVLTATQKTNYALCILIRRNHLK